MRAETINWKLTLPGLTLTRYTKCMYTAKGNQAMNNSVVAPVIVQFNTVECHQGWCTSEATRVGVPVRPPGSVYQ